MLQNKNYFGGYSRSSEVTDNPFQEFFQEGTVIEVDMASHTCTLKNNMPGGATLYDVQIANTTGGLGASGGAWMANLIGARVYYGYISGRPVVFGTLPSPSGNSGEPEMSEMSSDMTISADDGSSYVKLLTGGGVEFGASPSCKMSMVSGMDAMKIMSREFEISSDFGSIKSTHGSSGRTGFVFEGGAAYGDEAKAGSGTNTVHFHMGDTPDAPDMRIGMRVNSTDGAEHGAFGVGVDGKLVQSTSKDSWEQVGKDKDVSVDGNEQHKVKGGVASEVGKNQTHKVFGEQEVLIGRDKRQGVGGNYDLQVQGVLTIGAGGLVFTSPSGSGTACQLKCSSFNLVKA